MKPSTRSAWGFTLIELIIVVAVIGILAAIAMPQLAQYRMRSFNASAESDVRNGKTAEELLMHDLKAFGSSETGQLPGSGGTQGQGVLLGGPLTAGTVSTGGALLSGTAGNGETGAVGLGLSNGVLLRADSMAGDASFNIYGRHYQGNRAYASEAESTAILWCENNQWAGRNHLEATTHTVTTGGGDLEGKACGGRPGTLWQVQ